MRVLLVTLVVFSSLLANCSSWKSCGGTGVKINSFSLDGCSGDSDVCQLKRSTNLTMAITFTPQKNFDVLNVTVDATLALVHKKFPGPKSDICSHRNISCPMKQYKKQTLVFNIYLPDSYPLFILVDTKWSIKSSGGRLEGCFKEIFQVVR